MADQDRAQDQGRTDNAAEPKPPGETEVSPKDYPLADRGGPGERNPTPRQGAGDGPNPAGR